MLLKMNFEYLRYYQHSDALDCLKYINGTKLDERIIRTDLDPGYRDGRQYGRGKSGGQVIIILFYFILILYMQIVININILF